MTKSKSVGQVVEFGMNGVRKGRHQLEDLGIDVS